MRVGIDASLWYQHAQFAKGGENPELRLLFFRVLNLLELPIIPLFVFDGRERPKMKRGSKMGKSGSHAMTAKLKSMLTVFGVEWRMVRSFAIVNALLSLCIHGCMEYRLILWTRLEERPKRSLHF